jgi:hypothetical protein
MELLESSNSWRWKYKRPFDVHSPGLEASSLIGPILDARNYRSLERQAELLRLSGFPGHLAELGHAVVYEMRRRGYSITCSLIAGHLVACGGVWNFQGNRRIAKWCGLSVRTVQRVRKILERDELIHSYLLLPGDMVDGQRKPVTRPQVVRDVSALARLANLHAAQGLRARKSHRRRSSARPSVVDAPPVAPTSAELFDELAAKHPELASSLGVMANARRAAEQRPAAPKKTRDVPPAPTAAELDAIERELIESSPYFDPAPPDTPPRR